MSNLHLPLKQSIKALKEKLCEELREHGNIHHITQQLVASIDDVLITLFHQHQLDKNDDFCLLALGSYGRRELQLHSDIDILLLHREDLSPSALQRGQAFIQDCWDHGLELSHQLTTVNACALLASKELSVISSLLDIHLLCGRGAYMEELLYHIHPLHMWPSHEYFFAKYQEQRARHEKYGETAYNLEPNIKYGKGGLRDIHMIFTISKRHFGIKKLAEGISYGYITDKEYEELIHCQQSLWRIRFALHLLAGKREDRLLFDYQIKLAHLFGYEDTATSLAIEQFMKAYFNTIKRIRELNEILLQWYFEAIIYAEKQKILPLDECFQLSNQHIEAKHPKLFTDSPLALLQLFLWIASDSTIAGVRANTIRLIRQHLYLMTTTFRTSQAVTQTFMAILKSEGHVYRTLQFMSQYGVLQHYLTCFAAITGQMQYDLFHVYTVDQHTLFVIRNLERFLQPDYAAQFPLCATLMPHIEKREVLYLAALFHDIAKGRGGDHSELGALEAKAFAIQHGLDEYSQQLLVWLVHHHLLMSQTAQRQDIYDPSTIVYFCKQFPHASYLDYLYLLTVADICGTNPTLWNAWKDSLLKELYQAAHHLLQKNLKPIDETSLALQRQQQALNFLAQEDIAPEAARSLWAHFKEKYFLHETPDTIARHTKAILQCQQFPLVLIMPHHSQGGTEVFIYMPHLDKRFTITTTVLSNHQANIHEAAILTNENNFDLDTYIILDEKNHAFFDERRMNAIGQDLIKQLSSPTSMPAIVQRRLSRTQAHFNFKPQISYPYDAQQEQTCLFLVTGDRPGLLALISQVFLNENINLHNAKIATAGERVEDMFYISNSLGEKLTKKEQQDLRARLLKVLS